MAKGHLDALEYIVNQEKVIDFINLGTGKGSSVMEVLNAFETVSNKKFLSKYTLREKEMLKVVMLMLKKQKKYLTGNLNMILFQCVNQFMNIQKI